MRLQKLLVFAALPATAGCSIHTHYALIDDYTQPMVAAAARAALWPFVVVAVLSSIVGGVVVWAAIRWELRRRLATMFKAFRESGTADKSPAVPGAESDNRDPETPLNPLRSS